MFLKDKLFVAAEDSCSSGHPRKWARASALAPVPSPSPPPSIGEELGCSFLVVVFDIVKLEL